MCIRDRDNFSWQGKDPNGHQLFSAIMVDYDYEKVSAIQLTKGRFFSKQFSTDSNAVVLNEAAVKLINYKDPVGKTMKFSDQAVSIIGVVQNVVMENPFQS